jgi:hypothetical protein
MSVMLQHMVMFYKYGGKQLYYFNTYDGAGEVDVDKMAESNVMLKTEQINIEDDAACESCVI